MGKIQASGKKALVPKIRSLVEEGGCYEIENLLVTHSEPKFRYTGHRFRLNLIDQTKFTKIDCSDIAKYHYDFIPFREVLDSTKEDRYTGGLLL
jgi:hypothetical protein